MIALLGGEVMLLALSSLSFRFHESVLKSLKRAGDVSLVVWFTFQTSFISWAAYMLISELTVEM